MRDELDHRSGINPDYKEMGGGTIIVAELMTGICQSA
jgi:hypothetical protein